MVAGVLNRGKEIENLFLHRDWWMMMMMNLLSLLNQVVLCKNVVTICGQKGPASFWGCYIASFEERNKEKRKQGCRVKAFQCRVNEWGKINCLSYEEVVAALLLLLLPKVFWTCCRIAASGFCWKAGSLSTFWNRPISANSARRFAFSDRNLSDDLTGAALVAPADSAAFADCSSWMAVKISLKSERSAASWVRFCFCSFFLVL